MSAQPSAPAADVTNTLLSYLFFSYFFKSRAIKFQRFFGKPSEAGKLGPELHEGYLPREQRVRVAGRVTRGFQKTSEIDLKNIKPLAGFYAKQIGEIP